MSMRGRAWEVAASKRFIARCWWSIVRAGGGEGFRKGGVLLGLEMSLVGLFRGW